MKLKTIQGAYLFAMLLAMMPIALQAAQPGTATAVIEEYAESYPAYGVSESVRAGDFVYIGGLIAIDKEGNVIAPNDGAVQTQVVYDRLKRILAAHGATAKNVVSETIYLTDWDRFGAGAGIRKQFFDEVKAAYPSAVGQEVVSLALPGLVLELQVVAYVGPTKKVGE